MTESNESNVQHQVLQPSIVGTVSLYDDFMNFGPSIPIGIEFTDLTVDVKIPLKKNSFSEKLKLWQSKSESKRLIHGISGRVSPGQLLAVMGASGAGKSTMLNALANRRRPSSGFITWNGQPLNREYSRRSAFVQQDDIFLPHVTVEEHLEFQAKMRLPPQVSTIQRKRIIDRLIVRLGLEKCRSNKIGNLKMGGGRGISGGERKRLSIASELITDPSVLFLDEPTTGLDAFMAASVVKLLKHLSRSERTVVATIHQPSSDVFALFDWLLLLSEGKIAYYGPTKDAVTYFSKLNFVCPIDNNPADFLIRTLALPWGNPLKAAQVKTITDAWEDGHARRDMQLATPAEFAHEVAVERALMLRNSLTRASTMAATPMSQSLCTNDGYTNRNIFLVRSYSNNSSHLYDNVNGRQSGTETGRARLVIATTPISSTSAASNQRIQSFTRHSSTFFDDAAPINLDDIQDNHDGQTQSSTAVNNNDIHLIAANVFHSKQKYVDLFDTSKDEVVPFVTHGYATSYWRQFFILLRRAALNDVRDPLLMAVRIGQSIVIGGILGVLFLRLPNTQRAVQNKAGAIYFICMNQSLVALYGVLQTFPIERPIAQREYESGAYRIVAYYSAKIWSDCPYQIVMPLIFTSITYYTVGFNDNPLAFVLFSVIVLASTQAAVALGYLISASVPSVDVAVSCGNALLMPLAMVSGFLLNYDDIQPGWRWLEYISFFRYAFAGGLTAIFGTEYPNFNDCPENGYETVGCVHKGTDVLKYYSVPQTENYLWVCVAILIGMAVVFRSAGALLLYRHANHVKEKGTM